MNELNKLLKKHWGYSALKPLQQQAIQSVFDKKDTRVLLPTGGGKSMCYQLPAVQLPGLALVVSPLISLMQDQVNQLKKHKVKAMHLSGSLGAKALDERLTSAANGGYKLLYVSPERLQADWILERLQNMDISFLAVDEAHCISQWGYDFRPSYLNIKRVRQAMPNLPIMALTATATKQVLADISLELELQEPVDVIGSFFRKNLGLTLIETERKEARLLAILQKTRGTTIVYLRSRRRTEVIAKYLNENDISAQAYHAGMEYVDRQDAQEKWMNNRVRVMVATTAFGMGIDKADVRLVIHLDLPDSPESYYQEIGRAGRDGKNSHCISLYHGSDLEQLSKSTDDDPDIERIRKIYTAFFSQEQIAIGAGKYVERPIHLYAFSNKYNFSSRHVHQAFSLLDRMRFLSYEDVSNRPSSFRFNLSGNELFEFQIKNPSLEPITKALLRLYGGITEYVLDISEELISRKTGYPVKRVIKHLGILSKRNIGFYKKRFNGTTISLLTDRVPENQLNIAPGFLKQRKANKRKRAEAMIDFINDTTACRMQHLVGYFNEQSTIKCGLCDVCRHKTDNTDRTKVLAELLKEPCSIQQLTERLPLMTPEGISNALKKLVDSNKIEIDSKGNITLR